LANPCGPARRAAFRLRRVFKKQREWGVRFVVNADDLGMSQRVNDETFALMRDGLVNSASIIANGPVVLDAIRRSKDFPACRFGIHLNATEFTPVRPAAGLAPLLQSNGEFSTSTFLRSRKGIRVGRALYAEWSAQVERCLSQGLELSHFDSHHHVHTAPELFPVLKRLQWRFGVRQVRKSVNIYGPEHPKKRSTLLRKNLWAAALRLDGTRTTDYVANLIYVHEAIKSATLQRWIRRKGDTVWELIVHPGNQFDPGFDQEIMLLRSGWLQSLRRYLLE
jgi:predicted glycoside hydrolase/deacetylase ChbG (UPF0249 family)